MGPGRAEGPQTVRAATARPREENLGEMTKKHRKAGFWGPRRTQASDGARRTGRTGCEGVKDEGAHQHAGEKEGAAGKTKLVPCSSAPLPLVQIAIPRRAPRSARSGGREAADGAPVTSGPCLTLLAASWRRAACPPGAALRGPKRESRGAAGAPSCCEAPAPAPSHPLLVPATSPCPGASGEHGP